MVAYKGKANWEAEDGTNDHPIKITYYVKEETTLFGKNICINTSSVSSVWTEGFGTGLDIGRVDGEDGKVTFDENNQAVLYVIHDNTYYQITIIAEDPIIPVTEVNLDKDILDLTVGESEILDATIKPEDATNQNISWSTSDKKVATVDENGKVTAITAGIADITAEVDGKEAICTVTVNPITYTVTFKDHNNQELKTERVEYGSDAIAPADPSREGYTFTGWDTVFTNVTSDLTVTAEYEINKYTVTFQDHNGDVLKTETVEHGSDAIAPNDPERTGYTFTAWDVGFTNVTGNLIVTAQYKINKYIVTFVDYDERVIDTQTVDYDLAATAPADPTRVGYTFTGWDTDFINIKEDLTVKAKYEIVVYHITYELDEGINHESNPETYTIETETITLNDSSKKGHTFDGWYDAAEGGKKVEQIEKGSTGHKTFYARWINHQHSITFKLVNGEGNEVSDSPIELSTDPSNNGAVSKDEEVKIIVTGADNNNQLLDLKINGSKNFNLKETEGKEGEEFTFTMPDEDVVVVATVGEPNKQINIGENTVDLVNGKLKDGNEEIIDGLRWSYFADELIMHDYNGGYIQNNNFDTITIHVKGKENKITASNTEALNFHTTTIVGQDRDDDKLAIEVTGSASRAINQYLKIKNASVDVDISDSIANSGIAGGATINNGYLEVNVNTINKISYGIAERLDLENGGVAEITVVHEDPKGEDIQVRTNAAAPGIKGAYKISGEFMEGKGSKENPIELIARVPNTVNTINTSVFVGPSVTVYDESLESEVNKENWAADWSDNKTKVYASTEYGALTRYYKITIQKDEPAIVNPNGSLLQAATGTDFTGILYLRDGKIYYNQIDNSDNWSSELEVADGSSDARLAIDNSDTPHVVYVTEGKIAYSKLDGGSWSEADLIESNFGGTCSNPDITVDSNGKAHITYKDSMGDNVGNFSDQPDIMYASNISESFSSQTEYEVAYSGFKSDYGYADFYSWGSKIALDSLDDYYILSQVREWDDSPSHAYSILAKSGSTSGATDYESYSTTRTNHDIYDITSGGDSVVALYKGLGVIKTAKLISSEDEIKFNDPTTLGGAATPHSVTTNGTDIVVVGVNGNSLQVYYNEELKSNIDPTIKSNAKVSAVYAEGKFYVVYTDTDGDIQRLEIN